MIYTKRPPSNCKGARIAWDLIFKEEVPCQITSLWYARDMNAWAAYLDSKETAEVDELVVSWFRNNPLKLKEILVNN